MEGLGISGPTFIAQVVNFVILLVILSFFVYKPIIKMLEERPRKVRESLDEVQKIKEQAALAEDEFKKKLEAASKEGQEVISKAMRTGEEARQRAQLEAKQEAQVLVEKARAEIQRERNETIGELRQEFADTAVVAAEKIIEKSLDKETHRQLIEKVLDESSALKKK
ncbi:MAG: F0F1 ATP synthase subunit B [Dehalococcoidales bacterium]|nr:F0F1 ATP synthase subunit B [Dehalococcoidales bacterium]